MTKLKEGARERSFGFVMGAAAALLAVWAARGGRSGVSLTAAIVAVGLVGAALMRPAALREPARLWFALAVRLGAINARILLSLLFFLVLTPVGWVRRLRADPLGLDRRRYPGWVPPPSRHRDAKHFEHLY